MTLRLAAAAVAAGAVLSAGPTVAVGAAAARSGTPVARASALEHRYRIIGKVRLALFWTRGEAVGTARMTTRVTPEGTLRTLLVGSDPATAPRQLNHWGYVHEETVRNETTTFAVRTLPADEAEDMGIIVPPRRQFFQASCDVARNARVRTLLTTLDGDGATYRMFDRLLEHVVRARSWAEKEQAQPAGVTVGFLAAMERLVEGAGADPAALRRAPAVEYLYDGALYDLSVRNAVTVGPLEIGSRGFDRLTRAEFAILNRQTRDITRFTASFLADPAQPLPVQIAFQPNFWIRVELRLDDTADVPADPAADSATLRRIQAVCSEAIDLSDHTATGRKPSAPRNWRR